MKQPPSTLNELPKRMRPTEFAKLEAVSHRTVLNWIEAGIITPEYRIGKVITLDPIKCREQLSAASSHATTAK